MTKTHEFKAEILADGRERVTITALEGFFANKPSTYTTVRNINGSSRLVADGQGWSFLPTDCEDAAYAAIAAAKGETYRYPWMVPAWASIA